MKKILTYSLIGVFVLINLADLVTTLICYYLKSDFNEINPIYLLSGNIWVSLLVMKGLLILALFGVFRVLKSKSELGKYCVVLALILGCLMLFVAVNNNIKLIKNPSLSVDATEYIKSEAIKLNITENQLKGQIYKQNYVIPFFQSMGLILLIFVIYLRIKKEND